MSDERVDPVIVVTPNSPTGSKDDININYDEEIASGADKKKAKRRTRRGSRSRSGDGSQFDDTASDSGVTLHSSASADSLSEDSISLPSRSSAERHKRHNSSDKTSRRPGITVTGESGSSKRESAKERGERDRHDRSSGTEGSARSERRSHELQKDLQLDLSGPLGESNRDSARGSSKQGESTSTQYPDAVSLSSPTGQASTPNSVGHRRKSSADKVDLPGSARSGFSSPPLSVIHSPRSPRDGDLLPSTPRTTQPGTLTIYLGKGQIHSTYLNTSRTLRQVLKRLGEHRTDISLVNRVARDMDGNLVDMDIPLSDFKTNEVKYIPEEDNAARTSSNETITPSLSRELDLDLELMNKMQSLDAANIETIDEFVQGGHLMSGDSLDFGQDENTDDEHETFTRRKLKEIAQRLRDKETGVPVKNRKLRLRWFDNCFVASEAVKWMQDQLNITKEEAVTLGRGLEREGLIAHVTLRHNFDDSSGLLFRFEDEEASGTSGASTAASSAGGLGVNVGLGAAGGLGSASSGSNLSVVTEEPEVLPSISFASIPKAMGPMTGARKLTKIFDSTDLGASGFHQQFWNVQPPNSPNSARPGSSSVQRDNRSLTAKRRSLKTNMLLHALSSYVPNVVLRRFVTNPNKLEPPEVESYPASLLFADISGFTPLTEKLAQLGSRGVEQLTQYLNEYFGQMISIIFNHGGDIVKFAGDALLAIWPTTSESGLGYSASIAAQCALTMQEHLHNWDADGVPLTLHIGIGAGLIHGLHVGGVSNRMEFLIAGAPLEQAAHCEEAAKSGEVYISKEAALLIRDHIEVSVDKKSQATASTSTKVKVKKISIKPDLNDGQINYRLDRIVDAMPLPPSYQMPNVPGMKKLVSPYVQPAVLGHLKSGSPDHFLAELRTVSVIFVNLSLTYSAEHLDLMQQAVRMMQEAVYSYEGTIRQFIIDDKGSVLIAAFGLPPLSHEDDPARATRAAMVIHKNLKDMKIVSSVGVTTGKAFCGAVGSEERREYAMVGDIVNLSARLMAKASGGILCDNPTYMASRSRISYKTLPSITVKGKSMAIDVYSPQREVQHDSGHGMRRPEKFGSIGRAMLLKSKLRTSSSKLHVEERLVGRQNEWSHIVELITNLSTELDSVSDPENTPREDDSSSAEQPKSGAGSGDSGKGSSKKDSDTPRSRTRKEAEKAKGSKPSSAAGTPKMTPVITSTPTVTPHDVQRHSPKSSGLQRQESLRDVSSGEAKATVIFIQGEAGYGKSKILNEVLLLAARKRIRTAIGAAYSVESSTTYYAWRDIFASIFDLDRHPSSATLGHSAQLSASGGAMSDSRGSSPEKSEKVQERLQSVAPEWVDYAPLLTAILPQLDIADNAKTSQLTGQLRAAKTIQMCVQLLQTSPYKMFVLDNAHWLDSASWALALAAAQALPRTALVFSMRPLDEASSVEYKKLRRLAGVETVFLKALTKEEASELIMAKLEVKSVPAELAQLVVDKGSGNPLLISELIDALRHSGRIEVTPQGECRINRSLDKQLSTLGIPDTLRGLITSKIDRLTQSQQMILKVASVIGRVFPIDICQELMASLSSTGVSDEEQIMADLVTLESMDFIALKSEDPLSYSFKQSLAQEVVFDLMLWSQRKGLHEKVAEWYESHESEQGAAYSLLAHHWKEADNSEKAVLYFSKAGEQALANCANREAVNFFTECIELRAKQNQRTNGNGNNAAESLSSKDVKQRKQEHMWQLLSWQRQLGQAYYGLGLLDKAAEHLERALVLMNEPVKASEANHLISKLKVKSATKLPHIDLKLVKAASSENISSIPLSAKAGFMSSRSDGGGYEHISKHGNPRSTSASSAVASTNSSPTMSSSKKGRSAQNSSSQAVQNREYILILLTLGKVNYYACKKDVVTYCNLLALKKAEELGVSRELSEAAGNAIITAGMHGKHDLAESYVLYSSELANHFIKSDSEPYMNVMQMCGLYYTGVSNWRRSEECFEKGIKMAGEAGNARRLEECYIHHSTVQFLQGKIRESLLTNEMAVESARKRGDVQSQILAFVSQARNQVALGQMQTATQTLEAIESFVGKSDGYKLDVASEIIYHALMSLIYLHQKDYELSFKTAETVLTFLDACEPTAAFTFSGYMLLPEVFITVFLLAGKPTSAQKIRTPQKQILLKVERSIAHLAKFAKIFTFAEPRLLLWQGVFEQLNGKQDRAMAKWRQSLQMSRGLGMLYDEGLALLRIGKCTDVKDSREVVEEKLKSYDRALDLFTQLGAFYTEMPTD